MSRVRSASQNWRRDDDDVVVLALVVVVVVAHLLAYPGPGLAIDCAISLELISHHLAAQLTALALITRRLMPQ